MPDDHLENLLEWFGASKVVDEVGAPLRVFHGRSGDFSVFNTNGGTGKSFGTGAFFTSSPLVAASYAAGDEPNIAAVYLSLQHPVVIDADGRNWNSIARSAKVECPAVVVSDQADEDLLADLEGRPSMAGATRKLKARSTTVSRLFPGEWDYPDDTTSTDDLARWTRRQGYEGLIIRNVRDSGPSGRFAGEASRTPGTIFVAFQPSQIKSAWSAGTYCRHNPDFTDRLQRATDALEYLAGVRTAAAPGR